MDIRDQEVIPEAKDLEDILVHEGTQDLRVLEVILGAKDLEDILVLKVTLDTLDRKDQEGILDHRDRVVTQVQEVTQDHRVPEDTRALKDQEGILDLEVIQGLKERMQQVSLVLEVILDRLELVEEFQQVKLLQWH